MFIEKISTAALGSALINKQYVTPFLVRGRRRATPKDGAPAKEAGSNVLERGQLRMDLERHSCTWKNEPVTLTVTEFLILQALASRPGVVKRQWERFRYFR